MDRSSGWRSRTSQSASTFVIICLGESIVAIGVGAGNGSRHLTVELVAAVSLGLLITIAMWWTYFDRFAAVAERRLQSHGRPVLAASDGYSYLHVLIVAGIINFAAGVKLLAAGTAGAPLHPASRLATCGGVALYLLGNVAFRLRMVGSVDRGKLAVAAGVMLPYALGGGLSAWSLAAGITVLLAFLCVTEVITERRGSRPAASSQRSAR